MGKIYPLCQADSVPRTVLAGHAGGPAVRGQTTDALLVNPVERAMDDAGFGAAHVVGNSLGGYVALRLAAKGRARSVVALAPAGGWAAGDGSYEQVLASQLTTLDLVKAAAPHAPALLASREARRRATEHIVVNYEHIPIELPVHMTRGAANGSAAADLIEHARREGWSLDAEKVDRPVRILWGTHDRLLPWPSAAVRFRDDWLPQADWITLEGIGHCPQLDLPLETAQLILGFTSGFDARPR